jgi:hypothetical protein
MIISITIDGKHSHYCENTYYCLYCGPTPVGAIICNQIKLLSSLITHNEFLHISTLKGFITLSGIADVCVFVCIQFTGGHFGPSGHWPNVLYTHRHNQDHTNNKLYSPTCCTEFLAAQSFKKREIK